MNKNIISADDSGGKAQHQSVGVNLVDISFILVMIFSFSSGIGIRELGDLLFIFIVFYVIFYSVYSKELFKNNYFSLFSIIGITYIFMSYIDMLPDAWTNFYSSEKIPMQSFYIVMLYPVISSFRAIFKKIILGKPSKVMFVTVLIIMIPTSFLFNDANMPIHMSDVSYIEKIFPNLMNSTYAILLLAIILASALEAKYINILFAILITIGFYYDLSIQIKISLVMFLIVQIKYTSKFAFISFLFSFTLLCIAGITIIDINYIIDIDKNSAIRGYLWLDGLSLFWESYGVGVGFGKELVRNYYAPMAIDEFYTSEMIFTGGIHNSFISMFARLGLLGGLAFSLAFAKTAWPSHAPSQWRSSAYFAYITAYIGCWVNVAIESPLTIIGVAAMLGYVMAVKDIDANHALTH